MLKALWYQVLTREKSMMINKWINRIDMFNLSSDFRAFYDEYVVLPGETQSDLSKKKNNNIKWLKEGLVEYNKVKLTSYAIAETIVQGSMAMHTAVQNDNKDYDIDVAIVMDKDTIGSIGSLAIKNVIVDALKLKCPNYKDEPEAKTNCVRIYYAEGYHIDFAIYRRYADYYNCITFDHAGSTWRARDPKAINGWFQDLIKKKGQDLRAVVRLLKMFCKSRESWQMPGGLILSVLCAEQFIQYDRLDYTFYMTIKGIRDRLVISQHITNPTDITSSLILTEKHKSEVENLLSRLDSYIGKLDPLFQSNCTETIARGLWRDFFNHAFWESSTANKALSIFGPKSVTLPCQWRNTEEFIEDKFTTIDLYSVHISCTAMGDGYSRPLPLSHFGRIVPKHLSLTFKIDSCTVPEPYEVWWKIRNVGSEAKRRDDIRGQITNGNKKKKEKTVFAGPHFAECFIVKDGICVARSRIDVPIGQ